MGIRIMLDAGHYGKYNQSPAVKEYYESDFTFKFCQLLKAELEKYDIEVGLTREEQGKDLGLIARGKKAEGYDLILSAHSNAVGSVVNESVDYPVAITMADNDNTDIDEISKEIGERLAKCVEEVMETKQKARTNTRKSSNDRDGNGLYDDEYYGVLQGAKLAGVPGVILEHSFHTNTRATEWLLNADNLARLAEKEAEVLADYFGMKNQTVEVSEWYRVRKSWADKASQTGAYRDKDNAIKACGVGYAVYDNAGNEIYRYIEFSLASMPILSRGMSGESVKALQSVLNAIGYSVGSLDGVFGGNTEKAVLKFQKEHDVKQTGVVNSATWTSMFAR